MPFEFNSSLFFSALGLAFVMEGLLWLISPKNIRKAFTEILKQSDDVIRMFASTLLIIGLIIIWLATS